ncbi:hypothetical protein [Mycobacterium canetti]|uniref:hypothetical protein n=1 Tax=Mycobacterium canetti TaxID=78331 RepID=UPI0002E285ED|nr:hypothetical protein [Mycobacterium canetti]
MASVGKTLGDYSAGRRWGFGASMLLGAGLFTAGLTGDCLGWWKVLAFWPNAMTSLAGFFFGVPIALVLLSTIDQERENKSQRDKLEQLSSTAWDQFVHRVEAFCAPDRIEALHLVAKQLAPIWADIATQIVHFGRRDRGRHEGTGKPDTEYLTLVSRFLPWAEKIELLLSRIAVPAGSDLQVEWVGVQRSWAVLDTYVKLQRFELGLSWFSDQVDTRLQHKMLREGNPISDFSESHDLKKTLQYPALRDIPAYLKHCAELGFDALISEARKTTGPAYTLSSDRYAAKASAAAEFLELLALDVQQAEAEQWLGAG